MLNAYKTTDLDTNGSSTIVVVVDSDDGVVGWKEVRDGFTPFDDDDVGGVLQVFGEVFGHETGVGKAIKVVVNETAIVVW